MSSVYLRNLECPKCRSRMFTKVVDKSLIFCTWCGAIQDVQTSPTVINAKEEMMLQRKVDPVTASLNLTWHSCKESEKPEMIMTVKTWVSVMDPEDEVYSLLEQFEQFRRGVFRLTPAEFCKALNRSIGATEDYSKPLWKHFQDAPIHYICSRSDLVQKLELIRVCLELGKEEFDGETNSETKA